MFLLVTSPVTPIHGQTTPRSNTVSRTQLLADSTQMLVQRVYDNGLGDVTRKFGVKPSELAREQVLYKDSTDYLLGGSLVMRNGRVDKLYFEGGFARAFETGSTTDRFAFYYFNQDHLGNNREVVNAKAVSQVTNYYPFGAPYRVRNRLVMKSGRYDKSQFPDLVDFIKTIGNAYGQKVILKQAAGR
jgi:hypothetical protein